MEDMKRIYREDFDVNHGLRDADELLRRIQL